MILSSRLPVCPFVRISLLCVVLFVAWVLIFSIIPVSFGSVHVVCYACCCWFFSGLPFLFVAAPASPTWLASSSFLMRFRSKPARTIFDARPSVPCLCCSFFVLAARFTPTHSDAVPYASGRGSTAPQGCRFRMYVQDRGGGDSGGVLPMGSMVGPPRPYADSVSARRLRLSTMGVPHTCTGCGDVAVARPSVWRPGVSAQGGGCVGLLRFPSPPRLTAQPNQQGRDHPPRA